MGTHDDNLWGRMGSLLRSTREQLDHWVEAVARSPQLERLKIDAAFLVHERDRIITRLGEQTSRLLGGSVDLQAVVGEALGKLGSLVERIGSGGQPASWSTSDSSYQSPYAPPPVYEQGEEMPPFSDVDALDLDPQPTPRPKKAKSKSNSKAKKKAKPVAAVPAGEGLAAATPAAEGAPASKRRSKGGKGKAKSKKSSKPKSQKNKSKLPSEGGSPPAAT